MWQRTQNPPPLKACRFDSDLGHHLSVSLRRALAHSAPCNSLIPFWVVTHGSALHQPTYVGEVLQVRRRHGKPITLQTLADMAVVVHRTQR
jgi:hypothetical protein